MKHNKKQKNMTEYTRKSVFSELKPYDQIAGESDFIEVTEWKNGEGFDVEIGSKLPMRFQMTWGEYDALRQVVKKLGS